MEGNWTKTKETETIVDPLNGEPFIKSPLTSVDELEPFVRAARACPKSGLHNPLKNPERYQTYGSVIERAAHELGKPETMDFFARLIQRVVPKSYDQCWYEVLVTKQFLSNFGGDNPRFTASGEQVAGDRVGQRSSNWRWPYGSVALITPFNFPIEIPVLQMMGALMMGNHLTFKGDQRTSIVTEQFLRLLLDCGLPADDISLLNSDGPTMSELMRQADFRTTHLRARRQLRSSCAR